MINEQPDKGAAPAQTSAPATTLNCCTLEPLRDFDLRKLVGLGNYVEILVGKQPDSGDSLRNIYGFTEKGAMVSIGFNLMSNKVGIKVVEAMEGVVQKTLHGVDMNNDCTLPICLAHDMNYVTVVTSMIKPPLVHSLTADKLMYSFCRRFLVERRASRLPTICSRSA